MEITTNLDRNFTIKYNQLVRDYGQELAALNGLSEEQLSVTSFIDKFSKTETVADASIDGSANVKRKDIVSMIHEMPKSERKLIAFHKIYIELYEKYGKAVADEWFDKEWKGWLYMHDADTSSFISYCFAYDLKRMAEEGLFWLDHQNYLPAKHLETFVQFVKEFINYTSNRQSGAVGLPNLIPYMYYFWKKDVESNHYYGTPEKFAKQQIQSFIYAINQPYVRDGLQSAFTNTSVFDHEYLYALFGGSEFPDGSLMVDEIEGIMQFQKWFLEEMSVIKSENMYTFPVNSISILKDENGEPVDKEFAEYAIKHNMEWSDSNLFVDDSVTSLSNCCRLKSNIRDLGYFNSIGGSGLRVGSVKVSTLNLERLALESDSEEEYLDNLYNLCILDMQALDVVRNIIKRNSEKGLLPNFQEGLLDFKYLYNTVGFIGVFETMRIFGYTRKDQFGNTFYTDKAEIFGKKIFDTIQKAIEDFSVDKDYAINKEQIPGESAANKLMRKDKIFFGNKVPDDLPMLGNQFIPLGVKTTLSERVRIASMFDGFCNGGSILHVNIDAPFKSFENAWDAFMYVVKKGVTYFAFNPKISSCEKNHAFYGEICPKCGRRVKTVWSRIVGFFVPTDTFSKERKEEFDLRKWEDINSQHI